MKKNENIFEINSHPKFRTYGINTSSTFTSNKSTGTLGFKEVEVDSMSVDYITRPEFEQHQKHVDTRFDNVDTSIENAKIDLSKDIKNAILELKNEINKDKITDSRFKIGIAIPSVLSGISIIVSILLAIFF